MNHVGFLGFFQALEEDIELQETLTFKEAIKSSCKPQFIAAMEQDINNHDFRKNWSRCKMNTVPYERILRSTWTFRIKRNRSKNAIVNFEARFCEEGRSQEFGVNCNETHYRVVNWVVIRTCLTLPNLNNWHSRAIDFDQACKQAN